MLCLKGDSPSAGKRLLLISLIVKHLRVRYFFKMIHIRENSYRFANFAG